MFNSRIPEVEPETALEATARDYARVGWQVTSRLSNSIYLEKANQRVHLSTTTDGKITVDGPALSPFAMSGRQRAWLVLGVALLVTLLIAKVIGWL